MGKNATVIEPRWGLDEINRRRTTCNDSLAQDEDLLKWTIGDSVVIFNRDARNLSPISDDSVHLVVTSPPYNVGTDYSSYNDAMPIDQYLSFLEEVWTECKRVLVPGGKICVNVPAGVGRTPYVPIADYVCSGITRFFTLRGIIVWDKGTSGGRTSWGSYRLPTDPSIRDTTERIIVAHKGEPGVKLPLPEGIKKRDNKGVHTSFLEDGELFRAMTQDHWLINPESKARVKHPAPFPIEIPERLIRLYAYPGATVLDPFAGSGTTGVAALRLGKTYLPRCRTYLVDIDYDYCKLAVGRCLNEFG